MDVSAVTAEITKLQMQPGAGSLDFSGLIAVVNAATEPTIKPTI